MINKALTVAVLAVFCTIIVVEPASLAASAFRNAKLPHGITLSIPVDWKGLPEDIVKQAHETAEAVVDLSGFELNPRGYTCLLWINAPSETHYSSIKISIQLEKDAFLTQKMQAATSKKELQQLNTEMKKGYEKIYKAQGTKLGACPRIEQSTVQ